MKRVAAPVVFSLLTMVACSSTPETPTTTAAPAPAPPEVKDLTRLFPGAGKVSAVVVPDHILDMKPLPGGSLAEYNVKGKKYQEFIIDTDSAQTAAFMMLDVKAQLKDPQYISWMGGYFGIYGDKPVYCFAKLHYVAGVVGLVEDKADPIARTLAAQLH
jgi:hypothetical protein